MTLTPARRATQRKHTNSFVSFIALVLARFSYALILSCCLVDASAAGTVIGHVYCAVNSNPDEMSYVSVMVDGSGPIPTDAHGRFSAPRAGDSNSVHLTIAYDGVIASTSGFATRLQVMDEGHATRSDSMDLTGTATDGLIDLGTVSLSNVDCEIWRIGVAVLNDYHALMNSSPPTGQLRVLRWSFVQGIEYTFYDYINIRTDWLTARSMGARECTLFHEFGHTIRHVVDGSEDHWNYDDFRFAYARIHNDEIYNVQFAFNEGWANYWALARHSCLPGSRYPADYRDWNENLVANALFDDMQSVFGRPSSASQLLDAQVKMVNVLRQNPGTIHNLHEFEVKLNESLGRPAPPNPAVCPPEYHDDGATCRRDVSTITKPSQVRGAGSVPDSCGWTDEHDGALCYPKCAEGFYGSGPVCWQMCPSGYSDDGATCRRDARIIGADNSRCPWYDVCGLTLSRGCSACPPEFTNDGCSCRIDAHIFAKSSYTRGAGSPSGCAAGKQSDGGLCYDFCPTGMHGVGPMCWADRCPDGYDDNGATCFRNASVLIH